MRAECIKRTQCGSTGFSDEWLAQRVSESIGGRLCNKVDGLLEGLDQMVH